jgi:hypothetical protein
MNRWIPQQKELVDTGPEDSEKIPSSHIRTALTGILGSSVSGTTALTVVTIGP